MSNRVPFVTGEWYHCYNRGVDKRKVFQSRFEYERFLALMYLCNGTKNNAVSDRRDTSLHSILENASIDRGEPLVEIGAYALMPNHLHLILKEVTGGGIAKFMHRVFTGYTMYFNKKHDRTGALFGGVFKSKHVDDDEYFKKVMAYVLLNPADIFAPTWKEGKANISQLEKNLMRYPYASTADFFGQKRPEGKIVNFLIDEYYDERPTLRLLLDDAQAYYSKLTGGETSQH